MSDGKYFSTTKKGKGTECSAGKVGLFPLVLPPSLSLCLRPHRNIQFASQNSYTFYTRR